MFNSRRSPMGDAGAILQLSPSSLAALRRCGLATYRRRTASRPGGQRPSNPVARLGNAAHRVLEWTANEAATLALDSSVEQLVRERWLAEARTEEAAAQRHRSEASFGPLQSWPRYATIQESLVVDGSALASELALVPADRLWVERKATDASGYLRGAIDLVLLAADGTATVIDYKAGTVKDEDVEVGGRYRVQLLLYAAMVRDIGPEPVLAQVRPLGGMPIQIQVNDATIDAAVLQARSDVNSYNTAVGSGDIIQLARPSESACRWCEFLLDCPAIWSDPQPDLGDLHNLEGTVIHLQNQQPERVALELHVGDTDENTLVKGLSVRRAPAVKTLRVGDPVRIVGLSRTAGGAYRAGSGRLDIAKLDGLGAQLGGHVSPDEQFDWSREDGD